MQTELPITEPDASHQCEAATWIIKHPVLKNDNNDDEGASGSNDNKNITLLPLDINHIKVTVYVFRGSVCQSSCQSTRARSSGHAGWPKGEGKTDQRGPKAIKGIIEV